MAFTYVYAGWIGSAHDSRVLRNSTLYHDAENRYQVNVKKLKKLLLFLLYKIKELFGQGHLLGDQGYPNLKWILRPYKTKPNHTYTHFNKSLSKGRMIIENAFGLLKVKWRRMEKLVFHSEEKCALFSLACCVLHNAAIFYDKLNYLSVEDQDDTYDSMDDSTDDESDDENDVQEQIPDDPQGILKRDHIRLHLL